MANTLPTYLSKAKKRAIITTIIIDGIEGKLLMLTPNLMLRFGVLTSQGCHLIILTN